MIDDSGMALCPYGGVILPREWMMLSITPISLNAVVLERRGIVGRIEGHRPGVRGSFRTRERCGHRDIYIYIAALDTRTLLSDSDCMSLNQAQMSEPSSHFTLNMTPPNPISAALRRGPRTGPRIPHPTARLSAPHALGAGRRLFRRALAAPPGCQALRHLMDQRPLKQKGMSAGVYRKVLVC